MQMSFDVLFGSSNRNKFNEAKNILSNFKINLGFFKSSLTEIQAKSIKQIAALKVDDAYRRCNKPVIVEDSGPMHGIYDSTVPPTSTSVYQSQAAQRRCGQQATWSC